jgi:hypothetical protein
MAISNRNTSDLIEFIGFAILFAGLITGYLMLSSVDGFSGNIEKDEWYANYSHFLCEESIKKQLDDASSYMRDGNFKLVSDSGGRKSIAWKFSSGSSVNALGILTGVCEITQSPMRVSATYLNIS